MKLYFKQRMFSWFDSYDIYAEDGSTLYTVQGQLAWGHLLQIHDARGLHVGTVKEELFTFPPRFTLHQNGVEIGSIQKEFSLFKPSFKMDYKNWYIEGNFLEWDYSVFDAEGQVTATISKEVLQWTDTYIIDVDDPEDALSALMVVLAIDAIKCGQN